MAHVNSEATITLVKQSPSAQEWVLSFSELRSILLDVEKRGELEKFTIKKVEKPNIPLDTDRDLKDEVGFILNANLKQDQIYFILQERDQMFEISVSIDHVTNYPERYLNYCFINIFGKAQEITDILKNRGFLKDIRSTSGLM